MSDSETVYKFMYFLMQHKVALEFEEGILKATEGVSLYDFAKHKDVEPKNYITEAIRLGAISQDRAYEWNELNDLWREVLRNE